MTTITIDKPISDRQQALITKLLAEKDLTGTMYAGWTPDWTRATSKAAHDVIDDLLALPRQATPAAPENGAQEVEAGLYWAFGDHLIRVYHGQQSGRALAKRVHIERDGNQVDVSYEYLGMASKVLTPSATPQRLTIAEVSDIGKATLHLVDGKVTGTCLHCGRDLDDPESVDRGIGPVCASRY